MSCDLLNHLWFLECECDYVWCGYCESPELPYSSMRTVLIGYVSCMVRGDVPPTHWHIRTVAGGERMVYPVGFAWPDFESDLCASSNRACSSVPYLDPTTYGRPLIRSNSRCFSWPRGQSGDTPTTWSSQGDNRLDSNPRLWTMVYGVSSWYGVGTALPHGSPS